MKGNSRIRVRGIDPPLIHSIPAADSTSSDGRVVEKKNMDYLNLLMHKMESCEQGPKRASFSPLRTFTRSNGGGQDPYLCSGIQRKELNRHRAAPMNSEKEEGERTRKVGESSVSGRGLDQSKARKQKGKTQTLTQPIWSRSLPRSQTLFTGYKVRIRRSPGGFVLPLNAKSDTVSEEK